MKALITPNQQFGPFSEIQVLEDGYLCDSVHFQFSVVPDATIGDYVEPLPDPSLAILANEARVASLWKAAHEHEFSQISGSAIGLLTMGVLQGLPKCLAVQYWIKSIWDIYYTRKANGSTDSDYSSVGECPHSVPELMQELGFN